MQLVVSLYESITDPTGQKNLKVPYFVAYEPLSRDDQT